MCVYTYGSQKRVLDPLGLEIQVQWACCRCWKLTLGPLQEQRVLLVAESSLQPLASSSLCKSAPESTTDQQTQTHLFPKLPHPILSSCSHLNSQLIPQQLRQPGGGWDALSLGVIAFFFLLAAFSGIYCPCLTLWQSVICPIMLFYLNVNFMSPKETITS